MHLWSCSAFSECSQGVPDDRATCNRPLSRRNGDKESMAVTEQSGPEQQALPAPHKQKALPAPATVVASNGSLLRKLGLLLFLLACGAFGFYRYSNNKKEAAATQQKTEQAANRPTPVTVTPVVAKTMPIYLTALGTVTAYNTVTIKSRVDGQLLTVPVREGQQVRQGQVLATIDAKPYNAVVAQAEGQLTKDQATAANANAEAARYTALLNAGVISKESQQTQVTNAGQSAGTLAADRAQIQAAKVNVGYTRITSPINGVAGLRQVDAGNIVKAADANGLMVVTQLQPIAVIFTLPEDQLPIVMKGLKAGRKLIVEAFDRSETVHLASGTLLTVDNEIDTTTGTVKAKAVFDNRDGALFPNQFVNVRLILEQRANSLVIPAAALQSGSQGNFVYVVKPCPESGCPKPAGAPHGGGAKGAGGAEGSGAAGEGGQNKPAGPQYFVDDQPVTMDLTEGSQIILKDGVRPGDQVVIDGQEKLKKGSRVQPTQGSSRAGAAATKAIGDGPGGTAPAQPSSPDQGNPETKPHGVRGTGKPGQNGSGSAGPGSAE